MNFLSFLLAASLLTYPVHFHSVENKLEIQELKSIIEITLKMVDQEYNDNFVNLLLGTVATESSFGTDLGTQRFDCGLFQINYATEKDYIRRVLPKYPKYQKAILYYIRTYGIKKARTIIEYQVLIASLIYKERVGILKISNEYDGDVWTLAWIWKKVYNTKRGKGKTEHFYNKYVEYVSQGG